MSTLYSSERIERDDLRRFAEIALDVLRSTPYGRKYKKDLITIALCQGGANHYAINHGYARRYFDPKKKGLKDIRYLVLLNKERNEKWFHPQWHKNEDYGPSKFQPNPGEPTYVGRRMDFYGRSIAFISGDSVKSAIERWVENGSINSSPWYLSKKAIVAAYPENIIGKVLWLNPNLK